MLPFPVQLGLHKDLVHVPADEPEGEPIYFYAVYHLLNGGYDFAVWSKKKVENHRDKYSKSADNDFGSWKTSPIPMSLKTVLKAALNYAPKSIELTRQLSMDETVKKEIATDMSEVPAEEFDITPMKEELETVNKQTGEVTNDITEKEKKEIERAVDKKTEEEFISK